MTDVKQMEVDELLKVVENQPKNTVLLDVREIEEYNEGHIPGVHLLPTSQFEDRYEKELDKEKEYIAICRSGRRSQMVCEFLKEQGFNHCSNFAGGMIEWTGQVETADLPTDE